MCSRRKQERGGIDECERLGKTLLLQSPDPSHGVAQPRLVYERKVTASVL